MQFVFNGHFIRYGFVPLWSSLEGAITLVMGKSDFKKITTDISKVGLIIMIHLVCNLKEANFS